MPLFRADAGLSVRVRDRLRQSWAEWFREEVMPELFAVEGRFAGLYSETGRPNWSVARMLGVCLLQQLDSLDDQRALDALSFDIRWQHALGLSPDECYLSRRSLVEFRRRLVAMDPEGALMRGVFDQICNAGLKKLKLSTTHQRLDSTLICSNIRARGRLSLARETVRIFVRELPESKRATISAPIREWYAGNCDGWEHPVSAEEAQSRLHQMGEWITSLLEQFKNDQAVCAGEPYQHLARLLREHASAFGKEDDADIDDEPPAAPREANAHAKKARHKKSTRKAKRKKAKRNKASKARFWSPHDPDASFGHKGLGYHVHITETCRNESTELLTDYGVETAAQSDIGQAPPILERLRERARTPRVAYADGGYPTPADLIDARAAGTELYAPVHRGKLPKASFSRSDFVRDSDGDIVACPAGHAPIGTAWRESSDTHSPRRSLNVFFAAKNCIHCPHRKRCPVRTRNNDQSRGYRLDVADELCARDKRWDEQKTPAWRESYRIRAGIEATMSELKRGHGLGRLRVRRKTRVVLQVALKATACNIKRWHRAAQRLHAPLYAHATAILAVLTFISPPQPRPHLLATSA